MSLVQEQIATQRERFEAWRINRFNLIMAAGGTATAFQHAYQDLGDLFLDALAKIRDAEIAEARQNSAIVDLIAFANES